MECPICYCSQATCKLACKHSFCFDCVKKWYTKCPDESSPSCPMCRKNIYFKGINKKIDDWEDEHREYIFQNFFEEKLNEILEDVNPFSMLLLEFISERLEKIRNLDYIYDEDDIEFFILHDTIIEKYDIHDDIQPSKFLLNVSKHPQQPRKKTKRSFHRGFKDFPEETLFVLCF